MVRVRLRTPAAARTSAAVVAALALAACTDSPTPTPTSTTSRAGDLQVEVVAGGFEHPWDIGFLPGGGAVVSERPGRLSYLPSLEPGTEPVPLEADLDDVYAEGEGGLLGLAVHPGESQWPVLTACLNHAEDGRPVDVRLATFEIDTEARTAKRVDDPVTGLPTADGGRHSGCRPTFGPEGALYVGTGDSADPAVPQDRGSLGGKVLRIDPLTGGPWVGNPFEESEDLVERLVYTYGHRNVQGVAVRPGTEEIWTAEHGPSFDDEVTLLRPGGNAGWDPSRGGESDSYDESVPMTDTDRFPEAMPSVWASGETTEAICGAAFLDGEQWGERDGALAITALKGSKLILLTLDAKGSEVTATEIPEDLVDEHGRLRAARLGPDGALYVTTSNGDDDKVLRITPRG